MEICKCESLTPGRCFLCWLMGDVNLLFSPSSCCCSPDWIRCYSQPVCPTNELKIEKRHCWLRKYANSNQCRNSGIRFVDVFFPSYLVCRPAPVTDYCCSSDWGTFLSLSSILHLSQPAAPPSQHRYPPR